MLPHLENSDRPLLDHLRREASLGVSELATRLGVTATAVRQRLARLLASGHIERFASGSGRGRPSFQYRLADRGRRDVGSNFSDLAKALWEELRSISDPEVRRGLLQRLSQRLGAAYAGQIQGESVEARMGEVASLLQERNVPFEVDTRSGLPVLKALACPYTELAEQDRTICAMEKMLFANLIGEPLRLTQCRLDGESCCTFETHYSATEATS